MMILLWVWPFLGGDSANDDDSFAAWSHMDHDFLSRMSGPSYWTPLSHGHSSGLGRANPSPSVGHFPWLSAVGHASSVDDFRRFEVRSSSSMPADHVPTGMPTEVHVQDPAPADNLSRGMKLMFLCPLLFVCLC
jgi:hypothetical protein